MICLRIILTFISEPRNVCTLSSLLLRNDEQWDKGLVPSQSIYNSLFTPTEELAHNVV